MSVLIFTTSVDKTFELLTKILEELTSKPDSAIITAIISLGGMLIVAIMSIVTQIFITRHIVKSDFRKIQTQIQTEYDFKNRQEWINQFRKIIAELVTETDPELNDTFNKTRMISLINQAQLMLDTSKNDEKEIFGKITHLGMVVSDWHKDMLERTHYDNWEGVKDYSEDIFPIQSSIIEKTRILLCSK